MTASVAAADAAHLVQERRPESLRRDRPNGIDRILFRTRSDRSVEQNEEWPLGHACMEVHQSSVAGL